MFSIDPTAISTAQLHRYLTCSVAPRPIALASTTDKDGQQNLAPFSFFNVFSSNPPILVFSVNRRVRDNTTKHTLENILQTKEVVVNIVNHAMVYQTSLSSTEYDRGVNEFLKAGFTMLKSDIVPPCRVAESPVQYECRVKKVLPLGDNAGAGNLILAEVLKIHIQEKVLNTAKEIDPLKMDLVARMGSDWYTRAAEGMFEVPKPLRINGVGVDQIPSHIQLSRVLTANDLGRLGTVGQLPSQEEVEAFVAEHMKVRELLSSDDINQIHRKAQELLAKNKVLEAWKLLLAK